MKHFIYIFTIASLVTFLVSCSSDGNDCPDPPKEEKIYPTHEQYQNQIANRLWVKKEAKWMDDEGNIYPEMEGTGGSADCKAYFFLKDGYIIFPEEFPFSSVKNYKYSEKTGCFYLTNPEKIGCPQILSFDGKQIIIKNRVGGYSPDADSPKREDVWRYLRYVLEENPDWDNFLKYYILEYNPEDYGMK